MIDGYFIGSRSGLLRTGCDLSMYNGTDVSIKDNPVRGTSGQAAVDKTRLAGKFSYHVCTSILIENQSVGESFAESLESNAMYIGRIIFSSHPHQTKKEAVALPPAKPLFADYTTTNNCHQHLFQSPRRYSVLRSPLCRFPG